MNSMKKDRIEELTGFITVIDEPTIVEDTDKLLATYAEKLKPHRFKCSYENCNRILKTNKTESFKCTACGHGTMKLQKPQNYCCECEESIYSNARKDCDVVCDRCTAEKVSSIEELEKEVGSDIQNKQDYILAKNLLMARQKEGQSQKINAGRGKRAILTTISNKKKRRKT